MDAIERIFPLLLATVGPIAAIGAFRAVFQRLRTDVADHLRNDTESFRRIEDKLNIISERLAAIDGGPNHYER